MTRQDMFYLHMLIVQALYLLVSRIHTVCIIYGGTYRLNPTESGLPLKYSVLVKGDIVE